MNSYGLICDLNEHINDCTEINENFDIDNLIDDVSLFERNIITDIFKNKRFTVDDMFDEIPAQYESRKKLIDRILLNKKANKIKKIMTAPMLDDFVLILSTYSLDNTKQNICDMNMYYSIICDYIIDSRINDKRLSTLGPLDLTMINYLCKCYMQPCENKRMVNSLMIFNIALVFIAFITEKIDK